MEPISEGVSMLQRGVNALLGAGPGGLSSTELTGLLVQVEAVRRRLEAVDEVLLSATVQRSIAGEYGRCSAADLMVELLRVSPGEAKARVGRAADLGPRTTLSGDRLPPLLPATSAAVQRGEISGAHVQVISDCLEHLSPTITGDVFAIAETILVEAARHEHPGALRQSAAMLIARLDPDGLEPREDEIHRRREVNLTHNRDGSGRLTGRLTAETTAIWDTILDTLSAPAPQPGPGGEAEPDHRSATQRRHDALAEAGQRLLRSGSLPPTGGVPVTIIVRTTSDDLTTSNDLASDTTIDDLTTANTGSACGSGMGSGTAQTSRGDLISIRALLAMSSDAQIVPVVCNPDGAVLHLGRTRRLASRAQRLALTARDGGCCFPGCSRPAAWTEVHHIIAWQDGGPTDIDNLCLLCRFHHHEFQARGWTVRITDGVPEWTPPRWLDPRQRPQRNHAHHPPNINFDLGQAPAA